MISVKSNFGTLLLAIILINTQVFQCSGDKYGNFSIRNLRLKNPVISETQFEDMIKENSLINLDDDYKLSINYRIVELLHFIWLCNDDSDVPISQSTPAAEFTPFFTSYYWILDIKPFQKKDNDGITQIDNFKKYLFEFRDCMESYQDLDDCIKNDFCKQIKFDSTVCFENFDSMVKAYQKTKTCVDEHYPAHDKRISEIHTCLKSFRESTQKFEDKYNENIKAMQNALAKPSSEKIQQRKQKIEQQNSETDP